LSLCAADSGKGGEIVAHASVSLPQECEGV